MVQYSMALSRASLGVPERLRGSPENILAVMTIARSIQLPLATVMNNVFAHERGQGKVGERSRLLHMLARRAGHRLVIEHLDDTECRGVLWLHDQRSPIEVSYTILEAQRLELTEPYRDRDRNWQNQPANMLRNRWITRCVDWHCPEVKSGIDFASDGGLLIESVNDDPELVVTGLGPEVERILNEVDSAGRLPRPGNRYARLRAIWTEARLLVDTVVDDEGTTLGALLAARIAAARQDAQGEAPDQPPGDVPERDAPDGKRKARRLLEHARAERAERAAADRAAAETGWLPCGCEMGDVARTGSHAPSCADLAARLLGGDAGDEDRR